MTRGDIVIVAVKGPYTGTPRPAVVVQADRFTATHASVTVCPITSDCIDAPLFRIALPPGSRTGLTSASQVMVDKLVSVPRTSIPKVVGRCEAGELHGIDDALRYWLDV